MPSQETEVKKKHRRQTIRGFMFVCTQKTEDECFKRLLFGADKPYSPIVLRIRKGDLLFLRNLDTDMLYGIFEAVSDGQNNIQPDAWNGRYAYQVKVELLGEKMGLKNSNKTLNKLRVKRNKPISGKTLIALLNTFASGPSLFELRGSKIVDSLKKKLKDSVNEVDVEEEIPLIEPTTLWDFPRQSYGLTPKGDNKYPGVTPALIIYNLIWRYTEPGDVVVDPMCGSGTTIDVCREEGREVLGLDISPPPGRSDIIQSDARKIPLKDGFVDMVFIDSPYGDNIKYNDHPGCIGKISSERTRFYDELEDVMIESKRILREGKVLGWLIGDQWVKKRFTPVGLKIFERLCKHFVPVDIICVTRRGQSSHTGIWVSRARRLNFFLRGFKYLLVMKKASDEEILPDSRKTKWTQYKRG